MSFKVQVGPPQIAIHQGQTVLVTTIVPHANTALAYCSARNLCIGVPAHSRVRHSSVAIITKEPLDGKGF